MTREIERKFLVKNDNWKAQAYQKKHFAQGYLNNAANPENKCSIRVRIEGEEARLNIKSMEVGISRDEYEYEIPLEHAHKMLRTLVIGPLVEKVRYWVRYEGFVWEIDEFLGDNEGLVVAEVELSDEDILPPLPEWVGREVTDELRYYNVSLAQRPYKDWSDEEKY
jgi:adenylate cyclase